MTVSVRDARSSESDRLWIESVYRDYLDDLAPLNTGIFPVLGEVGHREPDQITRWFSDSTRIRARNREELQAGGIRHGRRAVSPRRGARLWTIRMAEFFIARSQRRLGVGRTAVQLILNRFAGRWEITEYLA